MGEITGSALLSLPFISLYARTRPTLGVRLHTASWGRVYVLQSVDFPQLFKIGFTTRPVSVRKAEIEHTMLAGRRMRIVFSVKVPFAPAIEQVAHNRLRRHRHTMAGGIEFFKGSPAQMVRAVRRAVIDVRRIARKRRRWSLEDDLLVSEFIPDGILPRSASRAPGR